MVRNRTGRTGASRHRAPPHGPCALRTPTRTPAHPHTRTPARPAFTLVELSLVLAAAALLAAIAVPRYAESMSRYRLQGAARRIADDLRRAQSAARSGSTPIVLDFNVLTESYQITGVRSLDLRAANETVELDEDFSINLHSAGFGGAPKAEFSGFGIPVAGGAVVLRSKRFSLTVTLDAQTGIVTIGTPQTFVIVAEIN